MWLPGVVSSGRTRLARPVAAVCYMLADQAPGFARRTAHSADGIWPPITYRLSWHISYRSMCVIATYWSTDRAVADLCITY